MSIVNHGTITELRAELFKALAGLSDKTIPIDRAKAVAEVAQTIINSAKVEVEFLKVTRGKGSGFFPDAAALPGEQGGATLIEQGPGYRITQHKLKG